MSKFNISLKEVSQHVTASPFAFAWSHSCLVKYNGQSFIIQKREVISKVSFLGLIIVVPIKKFKLVSSSYYILKVCCGRGIRYYMTYISSVALLIGDIYE